MQSSGSGDYTCVRYGATRSLEFFINKTILKSWLSELLYVLEIFLWVMSGGEIQCLSPAYMSGGEAVFFPHTSRGDDHCVLPAYVIRGRPLCSFRIRHEGKTTVLFPHTSWGKTTVLSAYLLWGEVQKNSPCRAAGGKSTVSPSTSLLIVARRSHTFYFYDSCQFIFTFSKSYNWFGLSLTWFTSVSQSPARRRRPGMLWWLTRRN